MRLEIFVLGLTAFFIYNAYSDGKYSKMLLSFKKYYKMIFYAVLGVGIYVLLKRNPNQGRNMLLYANNVVKFMPIDKTSMDMLSPIFDLTSTGDSSFMENFNNIPQDAPLHLASQDSVTILEVAKLIAREYSASVIPSDRTDSLQMKIQNTPDPFLMNFWSPKTSLEDGVRKIGRLMQNYEQ